LKATKTKEKVIPKYLNKKVVGKGEVFTCNFDAIGEKSESVRH